MSYLKYWLFRRLVYFLLTTAMLQTNRNISNVEKNKGVNFTENSPIPDFFPDFFPIRKIVVTL